jgi:RimJ/RimL family protein N-acetyltransferase
MTALPALTGRLSDGVIELRAIADWDIPEILIAHQDDREMATNLGLKRPPSGAVLGSEVENADAERAAGTMLRLTVVEPGREECRGRLVVSEVDWEARSARVQVWIAPALRGRGLARRAVALAAEWLRSRAGIEQLQC